MYIIILTILCRLKIAELKKRQIGDIGFINTNLIDDYQVKFHAKEAEANLLKSLLQNQNKYKILFPYNFKWVLLSCAYSVSLISPGYGNVIMTYACMRSFHYILLEIKLEQGVVTVLDSRRKDPQDYADMTQMLEK